MEQLGIGRKQWSRYLVERLNSLYAGETARAFHFVNWVPFLAPYLNGYRDHLPAIAHMVLHWRAALLRLDLIGRQLILERLGLRFPWTFIGNTRGW